MDTTVHPDHPEEPTAAPQGDWGADAASAAAEAAAAVTERFTERLHGLGEEIHRKINAVLASLPDRLASAGLEPEDIEHVRVGIEHAGERVAARIEMKVEQAVARARRVADRGERRARWGAGEGRRWGGGPGGFGRGQGAAPPSGSNAETLTVLRMLGEGKITADEAERLLAAMGRVSQSA